MVAFSIKSFFTFIKNQRAIFLWVYFCILYSVLLIFVPISLHQYHSFNYCTFIASLKIRYMILPTLFFFPKTVSLFFPLCLKACGILVPQPGIEPEPLALEALSLKTTELSGKSLHWILTVLYLYYQFLWVSLRLTLLPLSLCCYARNDVCSLNILLSNYIWLPPNSCCSPIIYCARQWFCAAGPVRRLCFGIQTPALANQANLLSPTGSWVQ